MGCIGRREPSSSNQWRQRAAPWRVDDICLFIVVMLSATGCDSKARDSPLRPNGEQTASEQGGDDSNSVVLDAGAGPQGDTTPEDTTPETNEEEGNGGSSGDAASTPDDRGSVDDAGGNSNADQSGEQNAGDNAGADETTDGGPSAETDADSDNEGAPGGGLTPPDEPPPFSLSTSELATLFASDEPSGNCYRIPSVVRSGNLIAVLAQRRQGYSLDEAAPGATPRRPVRLLKDKLQSVFACGDEAFTSIVMRIARVERDPNTGNLLPPSALAWSPEIVVVDMAKYATSAVDPRSRFFEPSLFDYRLRLQQGDFLFNNSGYLACRDEDDCAHLERCALGTEVGGANDGPCQALLGRNLFERYLDEELGVSVNPEQWLRADDNAQRLLNIRFGEQSATGYLDDDGIAWLTLAGILAYPTVPHAAHNTYKEGATMMKQAVVRVNLDQLYARYPSAGAMPDVSLDLDDVALDWHPSFNERTGEVCRATTRQWQSTTAGSSATGDFDTRLSSLAVEPVNLTQVAGLPRDIVIPTTSEEIVQLVRWHIHADDPLAAVLTLNNVSNAWKFIDFEEWRRSLRTVFRKENRYPEILRSPSTLARLEELLSDSDNFSWAELSESHSLLGIPMERQAASPTEALRLAYVMSLYAQGVNGRVVEIASMIRRNSSLNNHIVGERMMRLLFKRARFGPGNGLYLPADDRILLTVEGGFLLSIARDISDIDCNFDDFSITQGTERQAAILRRVNNQYHLFMTLRHLGLESSEIVGGVPQPFDLYSWTRNLSVSTDGGRTWSGDSQLAPSHLRCQANPSSTRPSFPVASCAATGSGFGKKLLVTPLLGDSPGAYVVERATHEGFLSTQVHAGVLSIPGFFGAGQNLLLHSHPSTGTEAIIENEPGLTMCLGESAGDATREYDSRCDYRYRLQVTPGRPADISAYGAAGSSGGATSVAWDFSARNVIHPGSAGYSAGIFVGRDDCYSASAAIAYEGSLSSNERQYRGFNDGVHVRFVRAQGGDYRHLPDCTADLDRSIAY